MAPSKGKTASRTEGARGFPRGRSANDQPSRRRPQLPLSGTKPAAKNRPGQKSSAQQRSSLIERAQGSVPGRKPTKGKGGLPGTVKDTLASFGSDKSRKPGKKKDRSAKPSRTGVAGLVAGAGLGAAALAKRRRSGGGDDASFTPASPSAQPPSPTTDATYSAEVAGSPPAT